MHFYASNRWKEEIRNESVNQDSCQALSQRSTCELDLRDIVRHGLSWSYRRPLHVSVPPSRAPGRQLQRLVDGTSMSHDITLTRGRVDFSLFTKQSKDYIKV